MKTKNIELILECECGGSKLYTPPDWQHQITFEWCSCGEMLAPVAFSKDLK